MAETSRFVAFRTCVAVALQPIVAGVCAFLLFPVLLLNERGEALAGGRPGDVTDAALSVALATGIVALIVGVAGAAVGLSLRARYGAVALPTALWFGLVFGNLPYLVMATLAGGTFGLEGFVRGVAFSSLLGLAGAAVFWTLALRDA